MTIKYLNQFRLDSGFKMLYIGSNTPIDSWVGRVLVPFYRKEATPTYYFAYETILYIFVDKNL